MPEIPETINVISANERTLYIDTDVGMVRLDLTRLQEILTEQWQQGVDVQGGDVLRLLGVTDADGGL